MIKQDYLGKGNCTSIACILFASTTLPSLVLKTRTWGYEAWLKNNTLYKTHLLSFLPSDKAESFLLLIVQSPEKILHILRKRLFVLFDRPELLERYNCRQLSKIAGLSTIIPLANLATVLEKVDLCKITKHNVKDLYKFVSNSLDFSEGRVRIVWGPGNNRYSSLNSVKHYRKHSEYDGEESYCLEYLQWEKMDMNDYPTYSEYALDSFYKMKDVLVHTNGRGVYLSGFHGNVFIVGRYNGDEYGISSCYYTDTPRKLGRELDAVFSLDFNFRLQRKPQSPENQIL